MISWLKLPINCEAIVIENVKITSEHVAAIDNLSLQKFRNDFIDLSLIEQFFETSAFIEFVNKVNSLKNKRWLCDSCRKTTGPKIVLQCDVCLAWYHLRCVGLKSVPKTQFYKCPECN
uniref:PHD-type domain-containing protein n=1 Tax=Tetranychus urticae TaxID=32264 RepID=T1KTL2_TETUR